MEGIVLGRLGHYFDAGNGSCSTALIIRTFDKEVSGRDWNAQKVNVAGWHHDGDAFSRTSVAINSTPSTDDSGNSFHLSANCPWSR